MDQQRKTRGKTFAPDDEALYREFVKAAVEGDIPTLEALRVLAEETRRFSWSGFAELGLPDPLVEAVAADRGGAAQWLVRVFGPPVTALTPEETQTLLRRLANTKNTAAVRWLARKFDLPLRDIADPASAEFVEQALADIYVPPSCVMYLVTLHSGTNRKTKESLVYAFDCNDKTGILYLPNLDFETTRAIQKLFPHPKHRAFMRPPGYKRVAATRENCADFSWLRPRITRALQLAGLSPGDNDCDLLWIYSKQG